MKNKIFFVVIFTFLFIPSVFSYEVSAKKISDSIRNYIEGRLKITEQYPFYREVRTRISEIISQLDDSETEKKQLLKDILFFHNNNLVRIVSKITSREWANIRFHEWKDNEIKKWEIYQNTLYEKYNIPDFVHVISAKREFVENGEIYKYSFSEIQPLWYNIPFSNKEDIFFSEEIGYFTSSFINRERKISFSEILEQWPQKFLLYSDAYFREGDIIILIVMILITLLIVHMESINQR